MSNKSGRPLNLEDIAALAKVSRSTVSRVVNNDRYVSARTRAQVMAVIEEQQFSPNPGGRMLMTQRLNSIGVVFMLPPDELFEDPYYFPLLLKGINEATRVRDFTTLLWLGREEEESSFHQRILKNRLMDGFMIASIGSRDTLIELTLKKRTPFVMVERPARHADSISYVIVDNVRAAREAVRHLIRGGRRRIGTVTGKLDHVDGQDRHEGYRQALSEAGLPLREEWVVEGDFSYRSGYAAARMFRQSGVDAVFAATDRAALGVHQGLTEAGVRVPQDVALVGFDDLPDPVLQEQLSLTTVQHHVAERSRLATELLLDRIEGVASGVDHVVLDAELVVRGSSAPVT